MAEDTSLAERVRSARTSMDLTNEYLGEGGRQQHIKLACQACQRKKIKCDRTFPCGQCLRSSLQCVPSHRKPRTKHSGRRALDSELRNRISKLEGLVESLSGEPAPTTTTTTPPAQLIYTSDNVTTPEDIPSPSVGKYIGSTFWSQLSDEVQGLRDALEDRESDEDPENLSPNSSGTSVSNVPEYDLLIVPHDHVMIMPGALSEPKPEIAAALYEIFMGNVEPIIKIFHRPTIRAFLDGSITYLGLDSRSAPCRALKAVVFFAAVTSLNAKECLDRFGTSRTDLLNTYRRRVDIALAQADLMVTSDIPTLQASVLFTFVSRQTDFSRKPWILTALLVRIATGMGLDHDAANASPFERELRRRLWHYLRILDIYVALDRGTPPLITFNSYDTPFPHHTNDDEWDEHSTAVPNHEKGFTDMTFSMMSFKASTLSFPMLQPEVQNKGVTWQQRLHLALQFGKDIKERYIEFCDRTIPLQRLMAIIGRSMSATCALRAVRPIHRSSTDVLPRVDSPFVMELTLNALREGEALSQDRDLDRYRWFFWTQWHALGVALAALCTVRNTELAEATWSYVERAYERNARHVADSKTGMLWRPMEKLYKAARAFRSGADANLGTAFSSARAGSLSGSSPSALPSSSTTPAAAPPANFVPSAGTAAMLTPTSVGRTTSQSPPDTTFPNSVFPSDATDAFFGLPMGDPEMLLDGLGHAGGMGAPAGMSEGDGLGGGGAMPDFQSAEFGWMDWERIMEDVNAMSAGEVAMGGATMAQAQQKQQALGQQFDPAPQTAWTFTMPANMLGDHEAADDGQHASGGFGYYGPSM